MAADVPLTFEQAISISLVSGGIVGIMSIFSNAIQNHLNRKSNERINNNIIGANERQNELLMEERQCMHESELNERYREIFFPQKVRAYNRIAKSAHEWLIVIQSADNIPEKINSHKELAASKYKEALLNEIFYMTDDVYKCLSDEINNYHQNTYNSNKELVLATARLFGKIITVLREDIKVYSLAKNPK